MSKNDIAIKVNDVHKTFRIPNSGNTDLKQKIVRFKNNKKGYHEFSPLNGITFEVEKGEFFGIVGRNGSGKSTLLKTIAGIYTPDSGGVKVDGKLVPFIELGVGFNPELTGRENVFLNGALLGFSRDEMNVMYDEIVDFAEIHDFMDERLKNYSSGMQVRLAFSIAIRAQGDILLLDEVLAVGDANFQRKCFEYFRKLKNERKTVILVTHSMDSVKKFCSRALMLEDGKISIIGDPDEVSDKYAVSNMNTTSQKAKEKSKNERKKFVEGDVIKSVRVLDQSNGDISVFKGGDPLKIKIDYDATSSKNSVFNVGIGLHMESGGYVFGYNTQMDNYKISAEKGSLVLEFKRMPLLNGNYYINVVCFTESESAPIDFKPKALSFDVVNISKQASYRGLVDIEHTWEN